MTSRSEISACPPFPLSALWPLNILWPCRSRTCCCLRGRHKERVWLLTLDRISLSLCLAFSFAPVFLRRETPSWSYYMPKLVSVCVYVYVQSIFAEAAAVHLLDGFSAFPLFTVLSTLYWFTNMFFMAFWCWCCRAANPSSSSYFSSSSGRTLTFIMLVVASVT